MLFRSHTIITKGPGLEAGQHFCAELDLLGVSLADYLVATALEQASLILHALGSNRHPVVQLMSAARDLVSNRQNIPGGIEFTH